VSILRIPFILDQPSGMGKAGGDQLLAAFRVTQDQRRGDGFYGGQDAVIPGR